MTKKPDDIVIPEVGAFRVLVKGNDVQVFSHICGYIGPKHADDLERIGKWFQEAAVFVRGKKSGSHRDIV